MHPRSPIPPTVKVVVSNAELKQALVRLDKTLSTGRYRKHLLHDLREVKMFERHLRGQSTNYDMVEMGLKTNNNTQGGE